ncbi:MAG: hypothetical protein KDB60_15860, partial [Propionibacteriaceae bacterium]|nr:hypothetical protein [Propionibacteriaceae bacterium]
MGRRVGRRVRQCAATTVIALVASGFGAAPAQAVSTSTGVRCTIVGTEGDDVLQGTSSRNVICGLGGNDTITGLGGNDVIDGGPGDDTIDGGSGSDTLLGGDGSDLLTGGSGWDKLNGGAGDDTLVGGSGRDSLTGGDGADHLLGGSSADKLNGGADDDLLEGGTGDDDLAGGTGNDTVSYAASAKRVAADLDGRADDGAKGEYDRIRTDVENLVGSSGADKLTGNSAANRLDGGAGADVLKGASGDDSLIGSDGNDLLLGGSGADDLSGDAGDDRLDGGEGADLVDGGEGRNICRQDEGDTKLFCSVEVTLDVAHAVSVSGSVVRADGSPVSGINMFSYGAVTDETGAFSTVLPDTKQSWGFWGSDYPLGTQGPDELGFRRTMAITTDQTWPIQLPGLVPVRVRVTDSSGTPVENAKVFLRNWEGDGEMSIKPARLWPGGPLFSGNQSDQHKTTDADGIAEFNILVPDEDLWVQVQRTNAIGMVSSRTVKG